MNKVLFASVAAISVFAACGATLTYLPDSKENGIYNWNTVGNWYVVDGAANGAVPSASDDVWITNSTFATECLVIPSDADVKISQLCLQRDKMSSKDGVWLKIDGGSLTTTTASDSYLGYQGVCGVVSVENGGAFRLQGALVVGYGASSNSMLKVDAKSTFHGKSLIIGNGGGVGVAGNTLGMVENRGVMAVSSDLKISFRNKLASNRKSRLDNYGTLCVTGSTYLCGAPLAHATVHNHQGAYMKCNNSFVCSYYTNSTAVFVNDGTAEFPYFYAGGVKGPQSLDTDAGTTAVVTNNGTMTADRLMLAYATNSVAHMRNNGSFNLTGTATFQIGCSTNSYGVFEQYGTYSASVAQYNVGDYGHGRFVVGADTDISFTSPGGTFYLGVKPDTDAFGELVVTNGATLTFLNGGKLVLGQKGKGQVEIFEDSCICGVTNVYVGNGATSEGRTFPGCLKMLGGEMRLTDDANAFISVGHGTVASDSSNGRIEGWGVFSKTEPSLSSGTHYVKMNLYNGLVRADGYGAERDLDMRVFQAVNISSAKSLNSCGTNGWYAVNKGRLRYPSRAHDGSLTGGRAIRTVGDYGRRPASQTELTLVNSFSVDFGTESILGSKYLHADLYATDRTDIPQGFPAGYRGAAALGVWRAGLSGNITEPDAASAVAFGSASVLIHYDAAALEALKVGGDFPRDLMLALYTHDGTAQGEWKRVAEVAPAAAPFISGSMTESSDAWNLGWFAIVPVRVSGTMLIVR